MRRGKKAMENMIYSELIKLKKSFIIPLVILGGLVLPCIYFISNLDIDYETIKNGYSAMDILGNINLLQLEFLNTVLFSLVGGYVFSREYINQTANVLYSYPVSRLKIFMSKAVVIFILICTVYVLNFVGSLITVGTCLGLEEVKKIFFMEFMTCVTSAILQVLIIPLPIFIGIISKNIILPAVYGIIGVVMSIFMSFTGLYMQLFPLLLPALPFYHFFRGDPIDYIAVILSGGITFSGSIIGIIFYLRNSDIN